MIYRGNDGLMREGFPHRMGPDMFDRLEQFLDGKQVVPLIDIYNDRYEVGKFTGGGFPIDTRLVGMRHDVDHNLEHAVKFARWEHERGYRSTYFILHTAWYFDPASPTFWSQIDELAELGHEIGIHTNAVAYARDAGPDPGHTRAAFMLEHAIGSLRALIDVTAMGDVRTETALSEHSHPIVGAAAHGDPRCDKYQVHNNDLWAEQRGEHDLRDFGLLYEAYFLHKPNWYISDSGGRWVPPEPLEHVTGKQTSMLIHPCHWDIDAEQATP